MKNKHLEQLKRKAKLYHQNSRGKHFENGVIVRHIYDIEHPQKLSWWDDVIFILNDYRVNVAWTHPRYAYDDKVKEIAYANCEHLQSPSFLDFMDECSPNYRKVGKSRKKIVSYTSRHEKNDTYFEALRTEENRIARDPSNGIVIVPTISTDWTDWSRFVSICAPIEVRGIMELCELATLVKGILKRETSLEREFPGYTYSQQNWTTEFKNNDQVGILSHAVKL